MIDLPFLGLRLFLFKLMALLCSRLVRVCGPHELACSRFWAGVGPHGSPLACSRSWVRGHSLLACNKSGKFSMSTTRNCSYFVR